VLINRFNATAAARAQAKTELLGTSLGVKPRPLSFLIVMFDSVSRQHFYRNFPKTIEFLNRVAEGKDFALYDFKINNVHGENTQPNLVPLLFGYDLKFHKQRLVDFSIKNDKDAWKYLELQEEALWSHFKEMGFVTLFGFDTVWDFLSHSTGRKILTDHVASNFWHACRRLFGYSDFIQRQRCIGTYNSHWYMLDYLRQYYENYSGLNRFAYVHLSPGHEETGTVIRSADVDTMEFFQTMLEAAANRDEDLVIMMASDHGKHSAEWDKTAEGYLENQLPMHLVVANRGLMQRLNADDVLITNSFRLVSRYDWHLTFRQLSLAPYGRLSVESAWYQALKHRSDSPHAVSLMMEYVKDCRTCDDMLIPTYYCTCIAYQELPLLQALAVEAVQATISLAVDAINRDIQLKHAHEFCMRVSLDEVQKVEVKLLKEESFANRNYKIRITLKENPKATFDLFSFMAVPSEFDSSAADNPRLGSQDVKFASSQGLIDVKVQLREVLRVDAYRGLCEETALLAETSASQCICYRPETYTYETQITAAQTLMLSRLQDKLTLRLGEAGQTCQEVCVAYSTVCQDWGLELYNKLEMLVQPWDISQSAQIHFRGQTLDFKYFGIYKGLRGGSGFGLKDGDTWELYLSDWSRMSCFTRIVELMPLCPCAN
jgi:hypothetical protein